MTRFEYYSQSVEMMARQNVYWDFEVQKYLTSDQADFDDENEALKYEIDYLNEDVF